jgi:type VI secretion system protein ImpJ
MGQALLPEHFYAQERSLSEEQFLRWRTLAVPQVGLATLELNQFQLREGVVVVESMVLFLPSGLVIDIPGNTDAPAPFPLKGPGGVNVPVFLHLISRPRILGSERTGTPDEESIERVVQCVELSTREEPEETAGQVFELAHFKQSPEGAWTLDPTFIPECVQVELPFFDTHLARMRVAVDTLQSIVAEDVQQNFLSSETFLSSKQCLRGIFEFRSLLADIDAADVNAHPYVLYGALRRFYVDLCIYRDFTPRNDLVYRHAALGEVFALLEREIEEHLDRTRRERPYEPFREEDGMQVCTLTVAAKKARDVYLMVEKPSVSAIVDASGLKLASKSRVQVVRVHSLRGILIERIQSPPFRHGFSAQMEFYRLQPGPEWDYAVTEGKVGFQPSSELRSLRTFLFWPGD